MQGPGEREGVDTIPMAPRAVAKKRVTRALMARALELGADMIVTQFSDGTLRFELLGHPGAESEASAGGARILRLP